MTDEGTFAYGECPCNVFLGRLNTCHFTCGEIEKVTGMFGLRRNLSTSSVGYMDFVEDERPDTIPLKGKALNVPSFSTKQTERRYL